VKINKKLKIAIISVISLIFIIWLGTMVVSYYVGYNLTHPKRKAITKTPDSYNLAYHDITFPSRIDHLKIKGWLIPADSATHKIVIEAHGYRDNRSDIKATLPVAAALHRAGFSVLMFDFRDEGNSPGKIVSVGEYETRDLLGAVDFAKSLKYKHIGVIGYSMGASTAILAAGKDTVISAVIADSPFANLHRYLAKHMPHWTNLPDFPFTQEILWELNAFYGLNPDNVAPDHTLLHWIPRPILLIAGTADRTIPMRNSKLLYSEIKSEPNAHIWIVKGAKHVGAFNIRPHKYLHKIISFFTKYLETHHQNKIVESHLVSPST